MHAPKPMLQVERPGDVGSVEISDLLFTSVGSLPGLVLVEWNVRAASPGAAGLWDAHVRVGGGYGSKMQAAQCAGTGGSSLRARLRGCIGHAAHDSWVQRLL